MPQYRYHYGPSQKVILAGIVVPAILCTITFFVPYWQTGTRVSGFDCSEGCEYYEELSIRLQGGIWWYCLGASETCHAYSLNYWTSRDGHKDWAIRVTAVINVVLTICCAVAAVYPNYRSPHEKTVILGIAGLVAGIVGIAAFSLYRDYAESGFFYELHDVEFRWAFIVYAVGVSILTVASILLLLMAIYKVYNGRVEEDQNNDGILDDVSTTYANSARHQMPKPGDYRLPVADHSRVSTYEHM